MKKYIFLIIWIYCFMFIFSSYSFAKYTFVEKMIAAYIKIDNEQIQITNSIENLELDEKNIISNTNNISNEQFYKIEYKDF